MQVVKALHRLRAYAREHPHSAAWAHAIDIILTRLEVTRG
jgi:hypothetical protein